MQSQLSKTNSILAYWCSIRKLQPHTTQHKKPDACTDQGGISERSLTQFDEVIIHKLNGSGGISALSFICAILLALLIYQTLGAHWRYLEVFHQHSDYYIDQHKLRHQYENNKKQRSNDSVDAAVRHARFWGITILTKCVLEGGRASQRDHLSYHIMETSCWPCHLVCDFVQFRTTGNFVAFMQYSLYIIQPCLPTTLFTFLREPHA